MTRFEQNQTTPRYLSPMKKLLALPTVLLLLSISTPVRSFPQTTKEGDNWEPFRFLIGEWTGKGSGSPGEAGGAFSFSFDLEEKILVRRNRAVYPATKEKPAYSHTDLMVIYKDGPATRAIYFDNEGHIINYVVTVPQDLPTRVTFLSDISASAPRFRFVYRKVNNDSMTFQFDIAPPGKPEAFTKYLEGSLVRKPPEK
jgi:hypothetical protein